MADMLVKLFALQPDPALAQRLQAEDVRIRRALPPDRDRVIGFVRENFPEFAAETACAFSHLPVHCYIATEGKILVGFACYEVTAPDFFWPHGRAGRPPAARHRPGAAAGQPAGTERAGLCLRRYRLAGQGRRRLLPECRGRPAHPGRHAGAVPEYDRTGVMLR